MKYQATGNDFILVDNREDTFPKYDNEFIKNICNRRLGIGADGLILLVNKSNFDFEMLYYNCDGNLGSMCGNGARSIIHFANHLGIEPKGDKFRFINNSNNYEGFIENEHNEKEALVRLCYDTQKTFTVKDKKYIDVGSPHYVEFYSNIEELNINNIARGINERYKDRTNVNFVKKLKGKIAIRTYERGVEEETMSCGTGAIASSMIYDFLSNKTNGKKHIGVETLGGNLYVSFFRNDNIYRRIELNGDVKYVFDGRVEYLK